MPTPEGKLTLKEFYETFSEEEKVTITVPLDLKNVDSESYELVNTYNSYLANNQYEEAYNYRVENSAKLEPLIFDAQKANTLQMLAIGSYQYVKGEKSAENTSYDNSNTGIEADTVQEAIDLILNSNATTLASRLSNIEEKLGNLYFKYVTSLPDSPDANTIYILPDKIYLGSKLIVSNNSNEVVYSNGTSVYAKINSLENTINTLESNFSTAADEIGAALVAKGCTVPEGTSLAEMVTLINNLKVLSPSVATVLLSVTFKSSEGGGQVSSYYSSATLGTTGNDITGGWSAAPYYSSGGVGSKIVSTINFIDLTDVTMLSVDYGGHRTHSGADPNNYVYVNLISESGTSTRIMTKQDIVDITKTTQDINVSGYNGKYKIQIECGVYESVWYGVSGIAFVSAIRVI